MWLEEAVHPEPAGRQEGYMRLYRLIFASRGLIPDAGPGPRSRVNIVLPRSTIDNGTAKIGSEFGRTARETVRKYPGVFHHKDTRRMRIVPAISQSALTQRYRSESSERRPRPYTRVEIRSLKMAAALQDRLRRTATEGGTLQQSVRGSYASACSVPVSHLRRYQREATDRTARENSRLVCELLVDGRARKVLARSETQKAPETSCAERYGTVRPALQLWGDQGRDSVSEDADWSHRMSPKFYTTEVKPKRMQGKKVGLSVGKASLARSASSFDIGQKRRRRFDVTATAGSFGPGHVAKPKHIPRATLRRKNCGV